VPREQPAFVQCYHRVAAWWRVAGRPGRLRLLKNGVLHPPRQPHLFAQAFKSPTGDQAGLCIRCRTRFPEYDCNSPSSPSTHDRVQGNCAFLGLYPLQRHVGGAGCAGRVSTAACSFADSRKWRRMAVRAPGLRQAFNRNQYSSGKHE
jgi:hypothetical protein